VWFPVVKFAIHMDVKYEDARAIRGSAEASNLDADFLGLSIVCWLLTLVHSALPFSCYRSLDAPVPGEPSSGNPVPRHGETANA